MKPLFIFFLTYLLIFFPSLYPNKLYSQSQIEMTIPWENDTMTQGLFAQQTPDGGYLILTENRYFYPGPGWPVSGTECFGNGLIKISPNGEVLWKKLYNTNGIPNYPPPAAFFIQRDSQIVIPYRFFAGLVVCDSISAVDTWSTGVLVVNSSTGEQMYNQLYYGDGFCADNSYEAFGVLNDSLFLTIEHNAIYEASSKVMLRNLKNPFPVFETPILDSLGNSYLTGLNWALSENEFIFNQKDSSFILPINEYFAKINNKGEMNYLFKPQKEGDNITNYKESFYFVYQVGLNGKGGSVLAKMNEKGEIIREIYFNKVSYSFAKEFSIGENGKILILSKNPDYRDFSSNEKPLRIILTDTSLNNFTYRDYGFRFIGGANIKLINNDEFIVTGVRFHISFDSDSINEPHQVYFLKSSIDSINIPWTSINGDVQKENNFFEFFPNPSYTSININFEHPFDDDYIYYLTIKNISGQIILHQEAHPGKSILNIQALPQGFYLMFLEEIANHSNNHASVKIKAVRKIIKINGE